MAFLPLLEEVVRSVDGALACSVMGFDGIAVENFQVDAAADLDVQSTLIEYAAVLQQVRKNAAELLKTGAVTEVSINSDQVLTVMRLVTDEYFVVLALKASGNYGKGRYALRIAAPRIRAELCRGPPRAPSQPRHPRGKGHRPWPVSSIRPSSGRA